jgi:chromosome condensin MukBEF MukE localization factor
VNAQHHRTFRIEAALRKGVDAREEARSSIRDGGGAALNVLASVTMIEMQSNLIT